MRIADRLAELALFSHFRPAELATLAECCVGRAYASGTPVLRQGETTADAYLLDRGGVDIQRSTPYGLFTLARLGPGQLFGEASFVDTNARSSDAVARGETLLVALPAMSLKELLDRDQRLAVALYWTFWRSLSAKLRLTNDQLTQFFAHSAQPTTARPPLLKPVTGEFRVDLNAKRDLFEEQKLSSLEINFLSSLSRERKLKSGQALFHEGDVGDAMYVVLEGRILISKFIPGAGEEALAILERGDYFGEMALIERAPRSAEAKAHDGGAVVLSIPQEVVAGILDMRKVSSLRLLKILCGLVAKRLREVDDKIVGWYILAGGDAPSAS